jgi:hypothetical protein
VRIIDFVDTGHRVGMRGKELEAIENVQVKEEAA